MSNILEENEIQNVGIVEENHNPVGLYKGSFSSEWYRERYRLAIIYKEEEKKQHKANDCFNVSSIYWAPNDTSYLHRRLQATAKIMFKVAKIFKLSEICEVSKTIELSTGRLKFQELSVPILEPSNTIC